MTSQYILAPFRRQPTIWWDDLLPDLLSTIANKLPNPTDLSHFRYVCRLWRSSTSPPPPNKISPLFPLRVPSFCLQSQSESETGSDSESVPESECIFTTEKKYIIAGAVYLVYPRTDPSKSWIISAQEPAPGHLLLRPALTYETIPASSGKSIDLSEWSVTPLATSYSFRFGRDYRELLQTTGFCKFCDFLVGYAKAVFVGDTAVYNLGPAPDMRLCALSVNGTGTGASQFVEDGFDETVDFDDFMNFNGNIYSVGREGALFWFDSAVVETFPQMGCECDDRGLGDGKRFVVSDGDLYIVSKMCVKFPEPECWVYKLVMDESGKECCSYEIVEDLGDRVLFLNPDCGFSLSVRDLPGCFQGNCVVVGKGAFPRCNCFLRGQELEVYDLGAGGKPAGFGVLQDYSALFNPPLPWINQLRRVQ